MFKIKHDRTADCVVAGYRPHKSGDDAIGSLLLGLYRDNGDLASVGVIGAFPMAPALAPGRAAAAGHDVRRHPWNWARGRRGHPHPAQFRVQPVERGQGPVVRPAAARAGGRGPLRPHGGPRFRHTAQFVRWRPDRNRGSCTYAQLEEPVSYSLSAILKPSP
jgi:ATP-dependent DNA ligase